METNPMPSKNKKNPAVAVIISAFLPGGGMLYLGNITRGLAYLIITFSLIAFLAQVRGGDSLIFALMLSGFYIYQLFDCYNEARAYLPESQAENATVNRNVSLTSSIVILSLGILFQLAELDIITYSNIADLWPLILIVIGVKLIFDFSKKNKEDNRNE